MEVWRPPQGSINECFPLHLDLLFSKEIVRTQYSEIDVHIKRAEIQLLLSDCKVVRGSRLGDSILDPYEIAEVTATAKEALEAFDEAEGGFEVSLAKSGLGIFARIKRAFKHTHRNEREIVVKKTSKILRIIPRTGERWEVIEPLAPNILTGRYLGEVVTERGGEKSSPLCQISAITPGASVTILLRIAERDIVTRTHQKNMGIPRRQGDRNKEVIINRLVCKSATGFLGVQPNNVSSSYTICHAELKVTGPNG